MKLESLEYLYLNDPSDNVATALSSFKAGTIVPVITSEGKKIGEIKLRTHVPIYFKVNVRDLSDDDPIVKLGAVIGITVARTTANTNSKDDRTTPKILIPSGTPIHDTNFIPTYELWQAWDGCAGAYDAIYELQFVSRQAPFKFGKAVKDISKNSDIRIADINLHESLRNRLFANIGVDENTVIGCAISRIPMHNYLRLGCCKEKEYDLPVSKENINVLIAAYRHSKRLVI